MMKKVLLLFLVTAMVLGITSIVGAKIVGTPHDLAPEPCAMCHTPHNGTGQYPLWNRAQTGASYTPYDSTSFDMGADIASYPQAPSSLCLVCHNGQSSTLVNYPGPCSSPDSAYDYDMPNFACGNLGSRTGGTSHTLTDDHPLSFTYNPALDTATDDNGFPDITVVGLGSGARDVIVGDLSGTYYPLYTDSASGRINQFECATCHAVHDTADYPDKGTMQVYFLRNDNTGSTMCQDCHTKR